MGIEPTGDVSPRRPTVLKTAPGTSRKTLPGLEIQNPNRRFDPGLILTLLKICRNDRSDKS